MTCFLDANVILYAASESEYREPCRRLLEMHARGEIDARTSSAVMEEVWWVELSRRAGNLDGLTASAYTALAPLLAVTDDVFRLALALDAPRLGPNDRLHASTCLENGIKAIVSADAGFDDVPGVRRVDPLDPGAVPELRG